MAKSPDFDSLSIPELQAFIEEAKAALNSKVDARRAELLKELESLGGVPAARAPSKAGAQTESRARAKPAIKYDDGRGNTWAGRGATPKWLAAYEAEGRSRDEFLVN